MKRLFAILTIVTMLVLGGGLAALAGGWDVPSLSEVRPDNNIFVPVVTDDMLDEILTYICEHGETAFKNSQGERRTFVYNQRLFHAMLVMKLEFVLVEEEGHGKNTSIAYYYQFGASSNLYALNLFDISTGRRVVLGELDKSATVYQDWTDLMLYRFWADVVRPSLEIDNSF